MTYDDFLYSVSHGEELLFYVNGKGYWISNNKDGYYLNPEIYDPEKQNDPLVYQEFNTGDDLVKNARIDGKPLREWWDQISRSFPE